MMKLGIQIAAIGAALGILPAVSAQVATVSVETLERAAQVWGDFPALSKAGDRVAILHEVDNTVSLEIHIVWRSDKGIHQRFVFAPPAATEQGTGSDHLELISRISEANAYLAEGEFRPMQPLYWIDAERMRPSVEEVLSAGYLITFNRDTGALAIGEVQSKDLPNWGSTLPFVPARFKMGEVAFSYTWSVSETRVVSGGVDGACNIRAVPYAGWINLDGDSSRPQVLVLRIGLVTQDESCELPDEWQIESLG